MEGQEQISAEELNAIFAPDEEYDRWLQEMAEEDMDSCEEDAESEAMEVEEVPEMRVAGVKRKGNWGRFELRPLEEVWGGWELPTVSRPSTHCSPLTMDITVPSIPMGISYLPPRSMQVWEERELVMHFLKLLQGLPSETVELTDAGYVLKGGIVVDGLSPVALKNLTAKTLQVASNLESTKAMVGALQAQCPTAYKPANQGASGIAPLVPSLVSCVGNLIDACCGYFMEVHRKWSAEHTAPCSRSRATLPGLSRVVVESGVEEWLRCLTHILKSASSLSKDSFGCAVLLSRLFKWSEMYAQKKMRFAPVASYLFLSCLEPYLTEVGVWITSGRLTLSPTQEPMIFITENTHRSVDPYRNWDERWKIQKERLPCFVDLEIAKTMATTGKSVRFLSSLRSRLISNSNEMIDTGEETSKNKAVQCHVPHLDFVEAFMASFRAYMAESGDRFKALSLDASAAGLDEASAKTINRFTATLTSGLCESQPIGPSIIRALHSTVVSYSERVGATLVRSLVQHCHMYEHLTILSGIFLLQRGDIMQHFCYKYLFPLARKGDWVGRPSSKEMRSHFQSSVLAATTGGIDVKSVLNLDVRWEDDGQDAASLRFNPNDDTPRQPLDKPPPPNALKIVSGFVLQLQSHGSQSPMNIVFPQEVTKAYCRVLQILLVVAYAQYLLVRLRVPRMPWKLTTLEKQIIATRLHLLHFIQALNDHLLQKVCTALQNVTHNQTSGLWASGMANVEKATDIERFRECHMQLAKSLLEAVNFSCRHREHWTTLLSIVKLIIKFEEITRTYVAWMHEVSIRLSVKGVTCVTREEEPVPALVADSIRTLPSTLRNEVMAQFRRHMQFFVATLRSQGGTSNSNEMLARFDFSGIYSGAMSTYHPMPVGVEAIRTVLQRVEDLQRALEEGSREQVMREEMMMNRIEALEKENRAMRPWGGVLANIESRMDAFSREEVLEEIDNMQTSIMDEVTNLLRSFKQHFVTIEHSLTEKQSALTSAVNHITVRLEDDFAKHGTLDTRLAAVEDQQHGMKHVQQRNIMPDPLVSRLTKQLAEHEAKIAAIEHETTRLAPDDHLNSKVQSLERSVSQLSTDTTTKMASLECRIKQPAHDDYEIQSIAGRLEEIDTALQGTLTTRNTLTSHIKTLEKAAHSKETATMQRLDELESQVSDAMSTNRKLALKVESMEKAVSAVRAASSTTEPDADMWQRMHAVETACQEAQSAAKKINKKIESLELVDQRVHAVEAACQEAQITAKKANNRMEAFELVEKRVHAVEATCHEAQTAAKKLGSKVEVLELVEPRVHALETTCQEMQASAKKVNSKMEAVELVEQRVHAVEVSFQEAQAATKKMNSKVEAMERCVQQSVLTRVEEVESAVQGVVEQEGKLQYKIELLEKSNGTKAAGDLQRVEMRLVTLEQAQEAQEERPAGRRAAGLDIDRGRLLGRIEALELSINDLCKAQDEVGALDTELRKVAAETSKTSERIKAYERSLNDELRALDKRVIDMEDRSRPKDVVSSLEHDRLASRVGTVEGKLHDCMTRHDAEQIIIKVEGIERTMQEDYARSHLEKKRQSSDSRFDMLSSRISDIEKAVKEGYTSSRLQSTLPFDKLTSRIDQLEVSLTETKPFDQHQLERVASKVDMLEKHARSRDDTYVHNKLKEYERVKQGLSDMGDKLHKLVVMEKVVNETLSDTSELKSRVLAVEMRAKGDAVPANVAERLRKLEEMIKGCKIDAVAQGNNLRELVSEAVNTANIAHKKASAVKQLNEADVVGIQQVLAGAKEEKKMVNQRMEEFSQSLVDVLGRVDKMQANVRTLKSQVQVLQSSEREEVKNLTAFITKVARQVQRIDEYQSLHDHTVNEQLQGLEEAVRQNGGQAGAAEVRGAEVKLTYDPPVVCRTMTSIPTTDALGARQRYVRGMQQDGDRIVPTVPGRPRSHSDMTVRFEEPDKNNTVSSKPSTSSTVRMNKAGTWRDSIGGLTLDSTLNVSPFVKSSSIPNSSIYKAARKIKLGLKGAAVSVALKARLPGAPPPPPSRTRRESIFVSGDSPSQRASISPKPSPFLPGRRASLASNMQSIRSNGSDEKLSINGWTVRVKKLAAEELESVIRSHASLMWSPKYLRGLGRRALVIDDDENDETAKLLFEKPRATAWFPVSCLDLLGRAGEPREKSREKEEKEKKRKVREAREERMVRMEEEKHVERRPIIRTLSVGDSACLISSSSALIGTVVAIDDDSPCPILVAWEGDTDGKVRISYHKDEELKKVDVKGRQKEVGYDPEAVLFHHYDDNNDGYWSLEETNRCLKETGQMLLSEEQYLQLCKEMKCDPAKGFLLADLRTMLTSDEVQRIYNALKQLLKRTGPYSLNGADAATKDSSSPRQNTSLSYWSSPERWSSPSPSRSTIVAVDV